MRRAQLVSTMTPALAVALAVALVVALATRALGAQQVGAVADTASLPAGFGTLRQDDISVRVQLNALQVRALPLDETILRTLSPDSYRALRELRESKRSLIAGLLKRTGLPGASLWYVQFFNAEQGEAPFSPLEVVINSAGQDFRALEVFALTSGFGEQRVLQREVQAGLYVFDPSVDVNQPLTITFGSMRNDIWGTLLKRVERERSLIRSRAAAKP